MKKIFILATLFVGFSTATTAQVKTEKKPERIRLVKGGESGVKETISPADEIKRCESNLKALDQKEAWLKKNPEELKKATEDGWFTDAKKTRAILNARIKELKEQTK